jgi:hypothetical protein
LPETIGYDQVLAYIDKPDLFAIPCNTTDKEDVRKSLVTLLTLAIDKSYSETDPKA